MEPVEFLARAGGDASRVGSSMRRARRRRSAAALARAEATRATTTATLNATTPLRRLRVATHSRRRASPRCVSFLNERRSTHAAKEPPRQRPGRQGGELLARRPGHSRPVVAAGSAASRRRRYYRLDNTIRRGPLTCGASVELANRGKISLGAVGDRPVDLDEKYLYVIDSTLNQIWIWRRP